MFSKNQNFSVLRFGMMLVLLVGMLGATPIKPVGATTLTVTSTSDSGAGSLREAITSAASGDTIKFAPSLAGQPITLTAGLLSVGDTALVSISSSGVQTNKDSSFSAVSADGRYVAFESLATNLVVDDTNGKSDIFVRDLQTGITQRVSVRSDGTQPYDYAYSYDPSISADGRYIVFYSNSVKLVDGDTNGSTDVFVHDLQTGLTTRVSVSSSGVQANSHVIEPFISANGRYVVFDSYATNLVAGDVNANNDVFMRDLQTGVTTRVSLNSSGAQANNWSFDPFISADGRYVTFGSRATNLVENDTNGIEDIFMRDLQTGITTCASIDSNGVQANDLSYHPSVSADGRYVVFYSEATNLVADDTNGKYDIFVHDFQTGVTKRVSVDSSGMQANDHSGNPSISSDGRYIAFYSSASNLVPVDTNGDSDVFVHDLQTGRTTRISVASNGSQADQSSYAPAVSSDGSYVTFWSHAWSLVPKDQNSAADIFIHRQDISLTSTPIHYVKQDASGMNNGTSWMDAYTDLQSALSAASNGDEIWVAAGTYSPTSGADRTISFVLQNGVAMYGGFSGTETLRTQRDFKTNLTVLSGDLGVLNDKSDNSYHVLTGSGLDTTTILDGFTITGGNANENELASGGGLLNGGWPGTSSPTLSNLIFSNNFANRYGGGIHNDGTYIHARSNPILTNVTFSGNSAAYGGGMVNQYGNSTLTNVTFHDNSASHGGGLYNFYQGNSVLTNVTFTGNSASYGGGLSNESNSSPTLRNVTISSNSATTSGGAIYNDSSTPTVTNSILYGNNGGEINNNSSTATVTYSVVQGGYSGTGNLDADPLLSPLDENGGFTQTMALDINSPALDAGDNANCPATDQRGVVRPQDGENDGSVICDLGAYEYEYVDTIAPTVSVFTVNTPSRTLNIDIIAFTVSDNVFVTGYLITMTSAQPLVDASGWSSIAPTTSAVASDGIYTLYPWAKDSAGNVSAMFATPATVIVDTTAPTVTMSSTAPDLTNASAIPVTVQFSETVTDFIVTDVTVTNGTADHFVVVDGDTYTFDLIPGGEGVVTAAIAQNAAKDVAGNGNVAAIPLSRTYDSVSPTVTIARLAGAANPTDAASVDFTVTFSEPVTGIETEASFPDFSLTTSDGIRNTSISAVSGDGTSYTVTVNTGIGSGTLQLNVVDDDSIQDAAGNPLGGGTGTISGEFYTIKKQSTLPGKPVGLLPATGTATNNAQLTFSWDSVANAVEYEIVFAGDSGFMQDAVSYFVTDPSFTPETPMAEGKYYWRVRAYNVANESGPWSAVHALTIDILGPTAPVLQSPLDGVTVRSVPTFRWKAVNGAVLYEFELDNDEDFSSPVVTVEQRTLSRKPAGGLRGMYYWHVRAQDAAGNWSEWSPVFTVTIARSR